MVEGLCEGCNLHLASGHCLPNNPDHATAFARPMTTASEPHSEGFPPARQPAPLLLNVGCGNRFHHDWVNLDIVAGDPSVVVHSAAEPLPFAEGAFAAVYHSHLLEHLPRERALPFLQECYRVLCPGGIIRVAVPDLERLAAVYLENLRGALGGDSQAQERYEWAVIELVDQLARQHADGGEMFRYLCQEPIPALDFVVERLGYEVTSKLEEIRSYVRGGLTPDKLAARRAAWGAEAIGRFRTSGEVHLWMYDRYSLGRLLEAAGFQEIQLMQAHSSRIPGFDQYNLDVLPDGTVRKPDSLFIEARKTTG